MEDTLFPAMEKSIKELALPRVGSAFIVVDEAGRFLLAERDKEPQKGGWVFPGGKIKAFENYITAGKREVLEETGLETEYVRQLGTFEIINPPDEHRIIIVSLASVLGGVLRPGTDVSKVAFCSFFDAAKMPLTPFTTMLLTKLVTIKL